MQLTVPEQESVQSNQKDGKVIRVSTADGFRLLICQRSKDQDVKTITSVKDNELRVQGKEP